MLYLDQALKTFMKTIKLTKYTMLVAALFAPMAALSYNALPLVAYQSDHPSKLSQEENHISAALKSKDLNSLMTYLESGDPEAQLFVAEQLYESAINPEESFRKSFLLTKESAKQGNKDAQLILSKMYYHGVGTNVDYNKSLDWLAHVDEDTKNIEAILEYAQTYLYGTDKIEPNIDLAIHWLKKAATMQHLPSVIDLAEIFENGRWVTPNEDSSKQYRLMAAKLGDPDSQLITAHNFHMDGDFYNAYDWYTRAEANGIREAKLDIGLMHLNGLGVNKDPVKAYVILSEAASEGDSEARRLRDDIAKSFDVYTLVEARKAARLYMQSKVL